MEDPATCSALNSFQMHHVALELDVHMNKKTISSVAKLWMKRVNGSTETTLHLDVFHLHIHSVMVIAMNESSVDDKKEVSNRQLDGLPLPAVWEVQPFTTFGDRLIITLPATFEHVQEFQLVIQYDTSEKSPAVCWLEKEQTAGKKHPFMYTQGQEVLNRSFFPCQDSPCVRITYDAKVTVPSELMCVMSANRCASSTLQNCTSDRTVFTFEMKQSISVYLVAMAVGDIKSADVGPRSSVWAEPCMLSACVNEFDGVLERYLGIGEKLFGPYEWERYDILVMPPSFPYGGMENPRLTFVSPCLIAGDQSLLSIIAHEISHSWFGNLVTNASWSDFFLNEGFTMYAERRIIAEAHGRPLACLAATIGEALLREEIRSLGEDSPLTRLRVPLETGIDPGDCYNQCAYEKGFAFVCYLRHLVGSDELFDAFLREYTQHFKFKSIAAEEMMDFFLSKFPNLVETTSGGKDLKGPYKFAQWLHNPGYPPFTPDLSDAKEMLDGSESLVFYWRSSELPVPSNVIFLTMEAKKTWPVFQLLHFLDCCMEIDFTHPDVVVELGTALEVWTSNNSEVRYRWSQVLIKNNMMNRLNDFVGRFLESQGKQKFQIPVYRALVNSLNTDIRAFAHEIYAITRSTLHVMVRDRIEALLATIPTTNK